MAAIITLRMSKGFLRPGLVCVRQNLSHERETVLAILTVRIALNIALDRIGGYGSARKALARHDVGMLVMSEQNMTGFIDIARPVLCLAVDSHDAVVPANSLIVFGGNAARVIQGTLAGEHHGCFRCHHQNASSMHEHGGFGIPVRLGSHVDTVD